MTACELFDRIRKYPSMFLCPPSAKTLRSFLIGYELASGSDTEFQKFSNEFGNWIRKRYRPHSSQHWTKIIEFNSSSEDEEMRLFWQLYDEFLGRGNMNRMIAIGDIHGHDLALKALLEKIQPKKEDEFVFLGDYINRGPDSPSVVQRIIDLKAFCTVHCIMGNHEEMLLGAYGSKEGEHYWKLFGGKETLKAYKAERASDLPGSHLLFFSNLLPYYENDTHIFVHANYDPGKSLKDTPANVLRWTALPKETVGHNSGKIVVCGHTPSLSVRKNKHVICIDTGCGVLSEGKLTAINLRDEKTWQVTFDGKSVE